MNGLLEILTTKKWMMSPDHLQSIRKALEQNIAGRIPFTAEKKTLGHVYRHDGEIVKSYCLTESGKGVGWSWGADEIEVPFVSVLEVEGPITRNGGGCSYGSRDHRDLMMLAANNENCRGHIFVINTPGGSAWAKNDYQQAIEYARSKGQPVIAFVDGLCASAGMYLAALCDERYYMHAEDEIGCIGVMAAFYTEKDGEKNQYTNETYHELYDPESVDKNRNIREIANNDDAKLLVKELAELGVQFRTDVKAACPNAQDKHLKGQIFPAKDVTGILMDGQSTLGEVITRVFALHEGTVSPIERIPAQSVEEPKEQIKTETQNNENIMEQKKLTALAEACGVEELIVTEEGTHLDLSLCENLNENLATNAADLAAANEKAENLQAELDKAKAEYEEVLANKEAEAIKAHEATIVTMQEEHKGEVEGLKSDYDNLKADMEKQLAEAKDALAVAKQTIADRDAQIQELTEKPADTTVQSPENNGQSVDGASINTMPAYDDSLSPEENARILNDWKKAHMF